MFVKMIRATLSAVAALGMATDVALADTLNYAPSSEGGLVSVSTNLTLTLVFG